MPRFEPRPGTVFQVIYVFSNENSVPNPADYPPGVGPQPQPQPPYIDDEPEPSPPEDDEDYKSVPPPPPPPSDYR